MHAWNRSLEICSTPHARKVVYVVYVRGLYNGFAVHLAAVRIANAVASYMYSKRFSFTIQNENNNLPLKKSKVFQMSQSAMSFYIQSFKNRDRFMTHKIVTDFPLRSIKSNLLTIRFIQNSPVFYLCFFLSDFSN